MPIYYNQPSFVDVERLVNVLNLVAGEEKVFRASANNPLYYNNPENNPVLLVIFVDDVSLDNLIKTVFPLWNQAKFDRIVVSFGQNIEAGNALATFLFRTEAVGNVKRKVVLTTSQETAFKTAVEKWIEKPSPPRIVPEVPICPLLVGFLDKESKEKANQLVKRIRAFIAYDKFATREIDSKDAVGLVIWKFRRTQLDVNDVVATIKRYNHQFQKMIIVWVDAAVAAGKPNEDILLEIPAILLKSGLNTDMGWAISEPNQTKVIEALEPFAKDGNKPVKWYALVNETSKLIKVDTFRDWLGALRWEPLPLDSKLSANEQYACMQALPPKDKIPPDLMRALEERIGTDPQVLTLTDELEHTRKQLSRLLDESITAPTEVKSPDISKMQEQLKRQEQVIDQWKQTEGKAKEQIRVLEQRAKDLESDLRDIKADRDRQVQELTTKLTVAEAKAKEAEAALTKLGAEAKKKEDEFATRIQELTTNKPVEEKKSEDAVDKELAELEKELEKNGVPTSSKIDELRAKLERKDALLKKVQADLQAIQKTRKLETVLAQPETTLQAEVKRLTQALEEEKKTNQGLQAEIVKLMTECKEATERQAPMALQIDQLQQENKSLTASTDKLLKANETMAKEIAELTVSVNLKSQQLAKMNVQDADEDTKNWKEIIDLWETESKQLFWTRKYLALDPPYPQVKQFIELPEPAMRNEFTKFQKSKSDAEKPKAD